MIFLNEKLTYKSAKPSLAFAKTSVNKNIQMTQSSSLLPSRVQMGSRLYFSNPNIGFGSSKDKLPQLLRQTKIGDAFLIVISELDTHPFERAYVFDKNGDFIAKTIDEDLIGCDFSKADKRKIRTSVKDNQKPGLIHSHKLNLTLSSIDIAEFFDYKYDSYMASLPNGAYASVIRTKPAVDISSNKRLVADIEKLEVAENAVGIKLFRSGISDKEAFHQLDVFEDGQLKRFFKKHDYLGIEYEYKKGEISDADVKKTIPFIEHLKNPENVLRQDGYSEKDIRNYLQELDRTPIANFFIR